MSILIEEFWKRPIYACEDRVMLDICCDRIEGNHSFLSFGLINYLFISLYSGFLADGEELENIPSVVFFNPN